MILIDIKYTASKEKIDQVRQAHRDYLQKFYDAGLMHASGPYNQKSGGFIISSMTMDQAKSYIVSDPFLLEKVAQFYIKDFDITNSSSKFKQFLLIL